MENNISKGTLAIILSKLATFPKANTNEEQYTTDSEIAAELLTNANILGDFTDKIVIDLGSGTGILGIGALLTGAKKVIFVEKDPTALKLAQENYANIKDQCNGTATFINKDITEFSHNADTVIMNPPFGTRKTHADKKFLEKAFNLAPVVYSFHKTSTKTFVEAIARDHQFSITHTWDYAFPLKKTMTFHQHKIHRITVTAYRFKKITKNL